jgi:hypothetical protein
VWREKSIRGEELPTYPIKGEYVLQGEMETPEIYITIEEDNGWIPTTKETSFQFLPTIFHQKFSFLNIFHRLMHGVNELGGMSFSEIHDVP